MGKGAPGGRKQASTRAEVLNGQGFHLRAASEFVRVASGFECEIRITYNGNTARGDSILDLLTLAADRGAVVHIEAEGEDAGRAIEVLSGLFSTRFGGME
jgi:phosphocarrier protein